jgi:hypothetical protein
MINSPFVAEQSAAFASRIAAVDAARQIDWAWMAALSRLPTARERELATGSLLKTRGSRPSVPPLATLAQSLFCTAEFSTLD